LTDFNTIFYHLVVASFFGPPCTYMSCFCIAIVCSMYFYHSAVNKSCW